MPEMPPEINTSEPHPARIYDYFIGGKNHFAADRATAADRKPAPDQLHRTDLWKMSHPRAS